MSAANEEAAVELRLPGVWVWPPLRPLLGSTAGAEAGRVRAVEEAQGALRALLNSYSRERRRRSASGTTTVTVSPDRTNASTLTTSEGSNTARRPPSTTSRARGPAATAAFRTSGAISP
jgi:hypothetical protein